MARLAAAAASLAAVALLVWLNLRGSRPAIQRVAGAHHDDHAELAAELARLRARVRQLELTRAPPPPPASASTPHAAPPPPPAGRGASAVPPPAPRERTRAAARRGERVVGLASYFTSVEVETPAGWCRKPPPYASPKPALEAAPPTDERPALTAALARKHASADNMLIATYVNFHRLDFAYTFVKHLRALRNPHFLVGALDEKALRELQQHGVPTFLIDSGLTTNDYGWGTQAFRKLGLHKVQLVLNLAKTGVDCLTVDADAVILRDPFPYIRRFKEAEVLMSSDHLVATKGYQDDGLESNSGFHSAFNIGFIWIKASALEFVQAWRDACYQNPDSWDQVLFANVLRRNARMQPVAHDLQQMFRKSDGTHVLAGVLPVSLFASGHTFFVSRMAHLMHDHPYMVHTTFQYGGAQGKRHRLREAMMWEDSEEYYSGQFLSIEVDVPYDLVYPRGGEVAEDGTQDFSNHMSVEQHFALVHHQLTQIRNAFALASALGRLLILPRLICGLDRWWAPHAGIIPGSAARLPLLECPADHVIDLERMGKPEAYLREAHLLCNPRTPPAVLRSLRAANSTSLRVAADGGGADAARRVGLPFVRRLAEEFADAKVLRLVGAPPDYRGVLSPRAVEEFEARFKGFGGLWCCNRPPGGRGAGHIWYDFFHDVVPRKDRFHRQWDGPWVPKMGP
ncbi:hypothetical protein AB1Y20_010837 [Prymnesium parvum]|uniref:Nucleotide-diphospho-sugar transferase domain-containing protein n=1 Tax=Prymnesium parvum TaxID=97485 RepID=A0AB34ISM5_PRYPA